MKKLVTVLLFTWGMKGQAQTVIPSYAIAVCFEKTTNLIFPYRIEKADIGSAAVIGHKDNGLANVLFLKANQRAFTPTNLSVYTADGRFYSFIVRYEEVPDTLNLSFVSDPKALVSVVDSFMDKRLDESARLAKKQRSFLDWKATAPELMVVLNGIYLKDHVLWFRIQLKNRSDIDYRPVLLQFSTKDKKVGKRTAMQEDPLPAIWKEPVVVPGNELGLAVFGFSEFTLSKRQQIVLHMEEKNGGRQISLRIPARLLLKARQL